MPTPKNQVKKSISRYTTLKVRKARRNVIRDLARKQGKTIETVTDEALVIGLSTLIQVNQNALITNNGAIAETNQVNPESAEIESKDVTHKALSNCTPQINESLITSAIPNRDNKSINQ